MAAAGINPMLGTYAYARDEYETMRSPESGHARMLAAGVSSFPADSKVSSIAGRCSLFAGRLPFTGSF